MFELKILTDLSNLPKKVETNIDEVEPIVQAAIARVDGLVVTDNKDEIIAADEDAAKLTKMSKAIARFRIDHVALWKEPMLAFEKKCKDAEKRLDEAATTLRAKTSEVKDKWRDKKRTECRSLWDAILAEAFGQDADVRTSDYQETFVAYWCDPKTKGTWVNSSVSMTTVEGAMKAEVERMKATMNAVMANYASETAEVQAAARLALLKRFDANDVILAVKAWKDNQAAIAARAAAIRQENPEQPKTPAVAANPAPVQPPAPAAKPTTAPERVETYRLAVTGTRMALTQLRQFGENIGISFAKIA